MNCTWPYLDLKKTYKKPDRFDFDITLIILSDAQDPLILSLTWIHLPIVPLAAIKLQFSGILVLSTVLCFFDGKEFLYTLGELDGKILSSPRGKNGFGYDPIFEVNGKTLAEMTLEEKSEISHRKNATIKMVELLNEK